jgi:hypothetical protein
MKLGRRKIIFGSLVVMLGNFLVPDAFVGISSRHHDLVGIFLVLVHTPYCIGFQLATTDSIKEFRKRFDYSMIEHDCFELVIKCILTVW